MPIHDPREYSFFIDQTNNQIIAVVATYCWNQKEAFMELGLDQACTILHNLYHLAEELGTMRKLREPNFCGLLHTIAHKKELGHVAPISPASILNT